MLNFASLLNKANKPASKAGFLAVGDVVTPSIRSDGGKGLVLKLGRVCHSDKSYASKKNPISLTVEIKTKAGETTTEVLSVTDADGCHLGTAERSEVEAMLAQIDTMTVKEIK
jgi:hypothetical protein